VERYLAEHAFKLDEQRFGDWARLLRYSAAGTLAERVAPQQTLGDMTLAQATIGVQGILRYFEMPQPVDDGVVIARPGGTLQIGLRWQAQDAPAGNYTVFTQLLDANSQVVAQRDRWPGDGLFPTAALQAGQVITDNLALELPADLPRGSYRLITGLYRGDVEGAPRLTGPGGDFVELPRIEVQP
jgi:hypothetical protein